MTEKVETGIYAEEINNEAYIAQVIARDVFGGVTEESPEWELCERTATSLAGKMNLRIKSRVFHRLSLDDAFKLCTEFNRQFPIGTKGVYRTHDKVIPCTVERESFVCPALFSTAEVLAWFSNIGWRPIDKFMKEAETASTAQELLNLAQQARGKQRNDLAEHLLKAAIVADPTMWQQHNELGALYIAMQRDEDALHEFRYANELNAESGEVLNNVGMAYRALGEPAKSLEACEDALRLSPGNGVIALNCAGALDDMGRADECLKIVNDHLAKRPEAENVQYNLALMLLGNGRFEEGWRQYDWRLKIPSANTFYEHFDIPRWQGEPLEGKHVLIWGEQGLGDEIMTASMIEDVQAQGAKITLLCHKRLVTLFQQSFEGRYNEVRVGQRPHIDLVFSFQRALLPPQFMPEVMRDQTFDYQMSQADMGREFRPSFDSFPALRRSFLKPSLEDALNWRQIFDRDYPGKCIIGVSWNSARNLRIGNLKSARLMDFEPILEIHDTVFINLQYGDVAKEIADVEAATDGLKVVDLGVNFLGDMAPVASLIAAMNAIVTVSNTTVHIAGGLGVPTYVLCPEGPARLWYHFRDRQDQPWYPSVKLFRQPGATRWAEPIAAIAAELRK